LPVVLQARRTLARARRQETPWSAAVCLPTRWASPPPAVRRSHHA